MCHWCIVSAFFGRRRSHVTVQRSRRQFLRYTVLASAASLLAACGTATPAAPTQPPAAPTAAPKPTTPPAADDGTRASGNGRTHCSSRRRADHCAHHGRRDGLVDHRRPHRHPGQAHGLLHAAIHCPADLVPVPGQAADGRRRLEPPTAPRVELGHRSGREVGHFPPASQHEVERRRAANGQGHLVHLQVDDGRPHRRGAWTNVDHHRLPGLPRRQDRFAAGPGNRRRQHLPR